MPVDVAATVVANTRLSEDYNVVRLASAEIAAAAAPGQFVMIKASAAHDPLLRRPFSIFEVLRDADGRPSGISLLNKRIGVSTRLLYDIQPGQTAACLGPLGRPWPSIEPSMKAMMVAGGVGLAPFATLAESLAARGIPSILFYGARSGRELFYVDFFRALGVDVVLTTEDGSAGERGRVTAPLERRLANADDGGSVIFTCGPEPMMAAVARLAMRFEVPCFASMERVMGCGLGGCYSCVVPVREGTDYHFRKSCIAGPVMAAHEIVWDWRTA
jgi:dihydroorotate dehydrogenase electron transfer subunit